MDNVNIKSETNETLDNVTIESETTETSEEYNYSDAYFNEEADLKYDLEDPGLASSLMSETSSILEPICSVFVIEDEVARVKTEVDKDFQDIYLPENAEDIQEKSFKDLMQNGINDIKPAMNTYKSIKKECSEDGESREGILQVLSLCNGSMCENTEMKSLNEKRIIASGSSSSQEETELTKRFRCRVCKYQTNHKGSLDKHILIHLDTKLLKCPECDYECNFKGNMKRHSLYHIRAREKLFKCAECDFVCKEKGEFKTHSLTHVKITTMLECSQCDYKCSRKYNMRHHILSHSNITLYNCSECDYGTNRRNKLKEHSLRHSDAKLLKCLQCEYECNSKFSLRMHALSHLGTKLFKCSECDYECNRKYHLTRHQRVHLKPNSNSEFK